MLKKMWNSVGDNAYAFMLMGMVIGVVGLFILMRFDKTGGPKSIAMIIGITGICVYVVGRIALVLKKKQKINTEREE